MAHHLIMFNMVDSDMLCPWRRRTFRRPLNPRAAGRAALPHDNLGVTLDAVVWVLNGARESRPPCWPSACGPSGRASPSTGGMICSYRGRLGYVQATLHLFSGSHLPCLGPHRGRIRHHLVLRHPGHGQAHVGHGPDPHLAHNTSLYT